MRLWSKQRWKKRKFKSVKRPSAYYPFPQSDGGIQITTNLYDLANALSPFFNDPRPFNHGDGDAELGPAYAFCENFIRFKCAMRGEKKINLSQLIRRLLKEFPNLENFDVIKLHGVIKKYDAKYGNDKWKKDPLYERSVKYWTKLLGKDTRQDDYTI